MWSFALTQKNALLQSINPISYIINTEYFWKNIQIQIKRIETKICWYFEQPTQVICVSNQILKSQIIKHRMNFIIYWLFSLLTYFDSEKHVFWTSAYLFCILYHKYFIRKELFDFFSKIGVLLHVYITLVLSIWYFFYVYAIPNFRIRINRTETCGFGWACSFR